MICTHERQALGVWAGCWRWRQAGAAGEGWRRSAKPAARQGRKQGTLPPPARRPCGLAKTHAHRRRCESWPAPRAPPVTTRCVCVWGGGQSRGAGFGRARRTLLTLRPPPLSSCANWIPFVCSARLTSLSASGYCARSDGSSRAWREQEGGAPPPARAHLPAAPPTPAPARTPGTFRWARWSAGAAACAPAPGS